MFDINNHKGDNINFLAFHLTYLSKPLYKLNYNDIFQTIYMYV